MTKAIILAAGPGKRMGAVTADRPKCLVQVFGKTILQRQLAVLKAVGMSSITLVTGHKAEAINEAGVQKIVNPDFARTDMVWSLMRASHLFNGQEDIVIVHGDIVFERRLLTQLLAAAASADAVFDKAWRRYWEMRFRDPIAAGKGTKLAPDGKVKSLGGKIRGFSDCDGMFVGLTKIGAGKQREFLGYWDRLKPDVAIEGRKPDQLRMTDFLGLAVKGGFDLRAVAVQGGWLEVDSREDLQLYEKMKRDGMLKDFIDLQ